MANSSRILFAFKTQSQPISLWSISTWNIVYLNEMQETSNSKRPQKWNNQANRSIAMSKAGAGNRTGSWEMWERERGRRWKRLLKTIFIPSRIHRTPARQSEIWKKDIALLNISYTWKVAGELKQRRWANAWDVITWIRTMLTMYLVSAMYNIKQVQSTVTCWSLFHSVSSLVVVAVAFLLRTEYKI